MPANPVHHTDTVDTPWDGKANEARLSVPVTPALGNGMYAWHDPNGADTDGDEYPDAKADSKMPHHEVGADGTPGAANVNACEDAMAGMDGSGIPMPDHEGVMAHLQAHIDDEEAGDAMESHAHLEDLAVASVALRAGRRYGHVARLFYERPWALHEDWIRKVDAVLSRRMAGVRLSPEDIASVMADRRADAGGDGEGDGWYRAGSVAVIPVFGVIAQRASMFAETSTSGTSIDGTRLALRQALADPNVGAVVLDVDSPGGSVDGVPEFAAELRTARAGGKPVVAQVDMLAASAAYWLAASCSEIVCSPSGEVGSIGVYSAHQDVSAALAAEGVRMTLISAGPYKVEGNAYEPLTDQARSTIQEQVDTFYSMFLGDVAKGRGLTTSQVASGYGEGRTMLARKALQAGMVDRIGTLEDTVRRMQGPANKGKAAPAASAIPTGQRAEAPAASLAAMRAFNDRNSRKRSTSR